MRYSLTNLLFLVLLFGSCSLKTTKGLLKEKSNLSNFKNVYFSDVSKDYVYKTKIDIYDNYFGGIMIFKKIGENHHRVVFTTEFGNKIFDFEFDNGIFKKNSIIDDLDKKLIVNTLKNDFKILLKENNTIINQYKDGNSKIYESKLDNRYNFFYVSDTTKELKKIVHTSKFKEKIAIVFTSVENTIAKKININHKNIQLNINLHYISN